jgi:hypothetical protein
MTRFLRRSEAANGKKQPYQQAPIQAQQMFGGKKRRLASGKRKDEQRNKSQRHPLEGPEEGNSPGTTARVEHKEL